MPVSLSFGHIPSAARRLAGDESGATSIEYSLIASVTALVALPALGAVGSKVAGVFDTVSAALEDVPGGAPPSRPPPETAPMKIGGG